MNEAIKLITQAAEVAVKYAEIQRVKIPLKPKIPQNRVPDERNAKGSSVTKAAGHHVFLSAQFRHKCLSKVNLRHWISATRQSIQDSN